MAMINYIYCGLICVGITFAILSTIGNYWFKASDSSEHGGIWYFCKLNGCEKRLNKADSLIATETFMIMGCLSYFLAFVLSLLSCSKILKTHKISAAVLCVTVKLNTSAQ
nr:uncharacterized protein LOC124819172 [Hydra vulgaris]